MIMDIFNGTADELKDHIAMLNRQATLHALLTSEEMAGILATPCEIGKTTVEFGPVMVDVEWRNGAITITGEMK